MKLGLEQRVAMVAAASQGLGLASATALAQEGAAVSLCARHLEGLEAARRTIQAAVPGAKVHLTACDVRDAHSLIRWHRETVAALGPVDVLVTNTGGPPAGRFGDLTEAQWQEGIEGTLLNVIRLCQVVLPSMRERKWGRIVHLTSFVAKQPTPLLTISATLRAGISALTKTLATQLASAGVCVNAVLPGHFLTARQHHLAEVRAKDRGTTPEQVLSDGQKEIPAGRYGRPEELGDLVAFLCSERASYLTGVSLTLDGGLVGATF